MEIINVTGLPPESEKEQVLAIGKFDGIHIGHQAIIDAAKADLGSDVLSVLSFTPHPVFVLANKQEYKRVLTPLADKERLLAQYGVDRLYLIHFTPEYAKTTAETFVFEHLHRLHLKRVIVGADFRFGQGGKAGVSELTELCARMGVPVTMAEQVEENGMKVSSSQIRAHLGAGRVEAAEALLGRAYSISGTVIHGDKLGRTIGFPTANLDGIDAYVLPKFGVYAVAVEVAGEPGNRGQNWFGVVNVGQRPTVNGQNLRVEAHLLGFDGDLYGKTLRVSFLRRIRDEQKFPGLAELKEQIRRDCEFARSVLGINGVHVN